VCTVASTAPGLVVLGARNTVHSGTGSLEPVPDLGITKQEVSLANKCMETHSDGPDCTCLKDLQK
jgi:hypothetical protein